MADSVTTRGDHAYGQLLAAAKGAQQVTVHTAAGAFRGYVFNCSSSNGMAEIRYDGDIFHVRVNHITALQFHSGAKNPEHQ